MQARRVIAALAVTALASTAAFGLPWDIDMADGQAKKAFSLPMNGLPDGVIAQPNLMSPLSYTENYTRMDPAVATLAGPEDASLVEGERMYGIYCTPCHGDGETLGPVAAPGRFPAVIPLSGPAGIAKVRNDGYLYLTIRNGGALMPSYGWAMNDREMWSIVKYVRTLPGTQHTPPPAVEDKP